MAGSYWKEGRICTGTKTQAIPERLRPSRLVLLWRKKPREWVQADHGHAGEGGEDEGVSAVKRPSVGLLVPGR